MDGGGKLGRRTERSWEGSAREGAAVGGDEMGEAGEEQNKEKTNSTLQVPALLPVTAGGAASEHSDTPLECADGVWRGMANTQ